MTSRTGQAERRGVASATAFRQNFRIRWIRRFGAVRRLDNSYLSLLSDGAVGTDYILSLDGSVATLGQPIQSDSHTQHRLTCFSGSVHGEPGLGLHSDWVVSRMLPQYQLRDRNVSCMRIGHGSDTNCSRTYFRMIQSELISTYQCCNLCGAWTITENQMAKMNSHYIKLIRHMVKGGRHRKSPISYT